MCAKVWSLNLWIIQIFRENAVFFNSLKTFLIKWNDGTLNGKKEQDSTKNSGSCFWQDLWDDKKRELLLNPLEEGTSMSPRLPNKCQLITFEIHEYISFSIWHYALLLIITGCIFLPPALSCGQVTNIRPVIINNKLYSNIFSAGHSFTSWNWKIYGGKWILVLNKLQD